MATLKTGRLSKKEMRTIEESIDHLPIEEIAKKLNRRINAVEGHIRKKGLNASPERHRVIVAEMGLKDTHDWLQLKKQFSGEELDLAIHHWAETIAQFRDDVLHTEKIQVLDLVKVEILMNRILRQQREQNEFADELRHRIQDLQEEDNLDVDLMDTLKSQISFAHAGSLNLQKEFMELLKEKKQMLKALKASREQRIKRLEDRNVTLTGWITDLLSNPERRRKLGIEMEKMRLAANVEVERLSEWHKYEDGKLDQPMLTPDTVRED